MIDLSDCHHGRYAVLAWQEEHSFTPAGGGVPGASTPALGVSSPTQAGAA